MDKVIPGRFTAKRDTDFVVFIIGMRVNNFWAFHKWIPVARAMVGMLKELYANPQLGFLHSSFHLSWRGTHLIQYWDSFEQLENYARNKDLHLKAWRNFNKKIGTEGTVGVFHESYLIKADQYECIYSNMPVMGLAKATEHIAVTGKRETASRRLGKNNEPAVPSPL